jgi:hypothetical protein
MLELLKNMRQPIAKRAGIIDKKRRNSGVFSAVA